MDTQLENGFVNIASDGEVIAKYFEEEYKVLVTGTGTLDKEKFHSFIENLPEVNWSEVEASVVIQDALILPEDCSNLFSGTHTSTRILKFGQLIFNPDIDASKVKNMKYMFSTYQNELPDISKWDVSNVVTMESMFNHMEKGNPDISKWDVSNVEDMHHMFSFTKSANPDVSEWNVSKVKDMSHMFRAALAADPDVSKWDVSNVVTMDSMFRFTKVAKPDMSNWNTSSLEDISSMFRDARVKEINIVNWDISNIKKSNNFFKFRTGSSAAASKKVFKKILNALVLVEEEKYALYGPIDNEDKSSSNRILLDTVSDTKPGIRRGLKKIKDDKAGFALRKALINKFNINTIRLVKNAEVPEGIYRSSIAKLEETDTVEVLVPVNSEEATIEGKATVKITKEEGVVVVDIPYTIIEV